MIVKPPPAWIWSKIVLGGVAARSGVTASVAVPPVYSSIGPVR